LGSLAYSGPALADCSPAAANNVIATCSGTITTTYGAGETNVTLTVSPGATWAKSASLVYDLAINVSVTSVTAYNYGSISVTGAAIMFIPDASSFYGSSSVNLNNFGSIAATSISGVASGVFSNASTVTNSGSITATTTGAGNAYGVYGGAASSLVNTGTISAVSGSGSAYAFFFSNAADSVTLGAGSKLI
jgi:hypothetical protein